MKKILIFTNVGAGLYRFRKELLGSLVEGGWSVSACLSLDVFSERLSDLGVTLVDVPVDRRGKSVFRDFLLYRRYLAVIKEIRPDVVLTYTVKPNIFGNFAARRFGLPVISTATGLGDGFMSGGAVGRLVRFLYKRAFKRVSCVVFQNDDDLDVMRRAGIIKGQKTLRVPGSGVNLQEHQLLPYPQDSSVVHFLFIGRIIRAKGVCELIEAARMLKAQCPGAFTVTLIGPFEEGLKDQVEQAERDGVITCLGYQKAAADFIENAHCVVLPSYREGMSNVLLEAAAKGRPSITTNTSGCRDIVDDGVNGFICPPKDARGLFECMKKFVELPHEQREQMGLKGREKVEGEFDRGLVVGAMISIINDQLSIIN